MARSGTTAEPPRSLQIRATTTRNPDGVITVGGVPLTELADRSGTPAYVIDEDGRVAQAHPKVDPASYPHTQLQEL